MINTSYTVYTGKSPNMSFLSANKKQTGEIHTNFTSAPANNDNNYTKSVYNDAGTVHTSWFYVNDLHGKMTKMERIYKISQDFDALSPAKTWSFFNEVADKDVNKFKVASGDISIGTNKNNNIVATKFLDWCGFIASALGNHEMDVVEPNDLASLISDTKCKMLALNVEVKEGSPLVDRFEKSVIVERNGEKFGIIGIAPSDMLDRVKMTDSLSSITVKDHAETIKLVQQEVDKLRERGINKIILLSHSGLENDRKLVKETDGIDIIFSAHTHELVNGIEAGKNLLYSKTGEPVILTEAGKNGEYVGILNVDFDKDGVVTRAQNNIVSVGPYTRPLYVKDAVEQVIGKPEVLGRVSKTVPMPKSILTEDNPHGNLIADAMRCELGADIAILNTGNIRGIFSQGPVDSRLVSDISPFEDKMMMISLSEKEIVDAIKFGCMSIVNHRPGILLLSGMQYTCNKNGELLKLDYIDKDGNVQPIDVNNPRTDKQYTVAVDDFFATGGDNYLQDPRPDSILKTYDFDKTKLACDYIKKLEQPIEIKYDGRIQIVD